MVESARRPDGQLQDYDSIDVVYPQLQRIRKCLGPSLARYVQRIRRYFIQTAGPGGNAPGTSVGSAAHVPARCCKGPPPLFLSESD